MEGSGRTPRRRVWAYLTAPGVIWWGLPVAIASTVWRQARDGGLSWAALTSGDFLLRLAIALVFMGLLGGHLFQWMLMKAGLARRLPSEHRDRAP